MEEVIKKLIEALEAANNHLDWIGWGDSYERGCANDDHLPEKIQEALETGNKALEMK